MDIRYNNDPIECCRPGDLDNLQDLQMPAHLYESMMPVYRDMAKQGSKFGLDSLIACHIAQLEVELEYMVFQMRRELSRHIQEINEDDHSQIRTREL